MNRLRTLVERAATSPKAWAIVPIVVINIAVVTLSAIWLQYSFSRYHSDAERNAISLSRIGEKSISTLLHGVDYSLLVAESGLRHCFAGKNNDCPNIPEILQESGRLYRGVHALFFANTDGIITSGVIDGKARYGLSLDISKRDYFLAAEASDGEKASLSKPLVGGITQKRAINLARPVLNENGLRSGYVIASIGLDHIKDILSVLELGKGGGASLRDEKMNVIARIPGIEQNDGLPVPTVISEGLKESLSKNSKEGIYHATTPLDNVVRAVAYTKSPDFPVYVNVGLSEDDYLSQWRKEVEIIAAANIMLVVLSFFSVLILVRMYEKQGAEIKQRKIAEQRLLDHQNSLEEKIQDRTADLLASQEEAFRLARVKSDFLASMSHEIRTPLNGIIGLAHAGQLRSGEHPRLASYFSKILSSSNLLLGVINDILDISKIEAGKMNLDETVLTTGEILSSVYSIMHDTARNKGVSLVLGIKGPRGHLIGDPVRLQQAVLNFASNAVKFTDQGRVTLCCITEDENESESRVRFEVRDTGIGIPLERQNALFNAFEQIDKSTTRKYGGTGLGLAITKRLIEMMGGEVGFSSEEGLGSVFWFSITLKKSDDAAVHEAICHQPAVEILSKRFRDVRILVVDDDATNRDVVHELMEETGIHIDDAENGIQAVEKAAQIMYDLILMDMQMPEMDGLDATRRIRLNPRYAHTPIIAMTANVFSDDRYRCADAGMNDFLSKPVDPVKLFDVVLKWLGDRPRIDN